MIDKENKISEEIIIGEQQEINRLEKEKCELLGIIQGKDTVIAELKAHCKAVDKVNEKMKCCGNCKHIEFRYFVESMQTKNITNYCSDCIRFIKINKKDKWESVE